MFDNFQHVVFSPSFMAAGALPLAHQAHHVDFDTGTISSTCFSLNSLSCFSSNIDIVKFSFFFFLKAGKR
jgi:hypothetical protein